MVLDLVDLVVNLEEELVIVVVVEKVVDHLQLMETLVLVLDGKEQVVIHRVVLKVEIGVMKVY